jgi:hypothetical protein
MIAELELTGLILKMVAVKKPRGNCEKTVKGRAGLQPANYYEMGSKK